MTLRPDDPNNGFHHDVVLAFINEQIARHAKGPQFYHENQTLSWEEIEDKFRAILEDSTVSREVQEACAWSSLALGMRFARRQGYLHGRRVQWLHDFARLHKSAAYALASDLKQLSEQQDMERREAAFQLKVIQTKLTEVQKECDMLRWKLLQAELSALPMAEGPGLGNNMTMAMATTSVIGGGEGSFINGASDKEDIAVIQFPTTNVGEDAAAEDAAAMMMTTNTTQEPGGSFQQLLGTMEWKNFPLGGQREGTVKTPEKATISHLETPEGTSSPKFLTVQLPASFTYSYDYPFPVMSTPSPPPPRDITPLPPLPSYFLTSDFNVLSDVGDTGNDTQELQKDKTDTETQQENNLPIFRQPEDWDCPWCKEVNFSQRESCICCGKGIWLQSS